MNTINGKIIKIGNSQGVRLPKTLLEQSGLEGEVELVAGEDSITIRKHRKPREGWDEAFKAAGAGREELLLGDDWIENEFDQEQWQW